VVVYDPDFDPDSTEWLALDEGDRIALAAEYHRASDISVPNLQLHAAFHAAVETQIAMGEELPVQRTLRRLVGEGLERHDAIHAIGSALAETMHGMFKEEERKSEDPKPTYFAALDRLTAKHWRRGGR
jgi:Domain of unknown function (DUF1841)